ncbi:proteoglycan 4-like isoform X4 [Labeo rohita]|uniref:Proteoglycan 4-like isoform X4 n=1 Tax=Labeo rohita TaxID=84645 RepID=A0A498NB36_LABRO|nr:proteoglycan 4-like isoform X4 [Labeo rohita]
MGSDQSQAQIKITCALCETSDETEITGPLSSKESISAHQNCLLFASGIYCQNSPTFDDLFGFEVEDVKKELKRGRRLVVREEGVNHCLRFWLCKNINPSTTETDDDTDIDSEESESLLLTKTYRITVPCTVIMDSGTSEHSLEPSSPAGGAPAAVCTSPGSVTTPEHKETPSPRAQTTDPVSSGTIYSMSTLDYFIDGPSDQPASPQHSSPTVDVPAVSTSAVQTISASPLKSERLPVLSSRAGISSSPGRPAAADASDSCHRCKKIGATAGCEVGRCKRSYHYPCAIEDDAISIEDSSKGRYVLFCKLHDPESKKPNDDDIECMDAPVKSEIEDCTPPNQNNQSTPYPESKRPCAEPSPSTRGSLNLTSAQKAGGSADNPGELHGKRIFDSPKQSPEVETPRRKKIKRVLDSDDESPTRTDRVVAPAVSDAEDSVLPKQPNQSTPVPEKTRPCEKLNPSTTEADDDTDIDSDESQSLLTSKTYRITVPCTVIMDSGPSAESEHSLETSSPVRAAPAAVCTSPGSVTTPEHKETPSTSRSSPPPRAQTTDPVSPDLEKQERDLQRKRAALRDAKAVLGV